jgi:hypothetical protein
MSDPSDCEHNWIWVDNGSRPEYWKCTKCGNCDGPPSGECSDSAYLDMKPLILQQRKESGDGV